MANAPHTADLSRGSDGSSPRNHERWNHFLRGELLHDAQGKDEPGTRPADVIQFDVDLDRELILTRDEHADDRNRGLPLAHPRNDFEALLAPRPVDRERNRRLNTVFGNQCTQLGDIADLFPGRSENDVAGLQDPLSGSPLLHHGHLEEGGVGDVELGEGSGNRLLLRVFHVDPCCLAVVLDARARGERDIDGHDRTLPRGPASKDIPPRGQVVRISHPGHCRQPKLPRLGVLLCSRDANEWKLLLINGHRPQRVEGRSGLVDDVGGGEEAQHQGGRDREGEQKPTDQAGALANVLGRIFRRIQDHPVDPLRCRQTPQA